jgi:hypothetical protein
MGTGYEETPLPLRVTSIVGFAGSLVTIVNVPVLLPACAGANVTLRTQPLPGKIEAGQFKAEYEKSPLVTV